MTHYDYLIIGGGMASAAAVAGIREQDKTGSIGIIAAEHETLYDRPPLSKKLWTGNKQLESIFRYHELPADVTVHNGRTAEQLDRQQKQVLDDQGDSYVYGKLLLAMGSTPRHLPFGKGTIIYYRTVEDYKRLHRMSEDDDHFAVIGGGFIGSEIAAALAMQGKQVTLIFPEEGLCNRIFPADVSRFLNDYYRQKGVEVLPGSSVTNVTGSGTDLTVTLENGRTLSVQGVVAGIGVTPNVELAKDADLEVDNGIVVNEHLQTSDPAIYAAGDVANYPDALLGKRRRVEHADAANSMGETAGRAMAGDPVAYDYSPYFYSDLFDLGYEAVGELDSRLDMVTDWQEPYQKGVIYYLRDDYVRGVLLWNTWDQVDAARKLIAEHIPLSREDLRGRLSD